MLFAQDAGRIRFSIAPNDYDQPGALGYAESFASNVGSRISLFTESGSNGLCHCNGTNHLCVSILARSILLKGYDWIN